MLHLSTLIIKAAHDDHFVNALTRCWLLLSRSVTIAVSSANCSQCFGDIQPSSIYPMQFNFSCLIVLISVLITKLKSNGDELSPCNTPFLTVIGSVKYSSVAIDIR